MGGGLFPLALMKERQRQVEMGFGLSVFNRSASW